MLMPEASDVTCSTKSSTAVDVGMSCVHLDLRNLSCSKTIHLIECMCTVTPFILTASVNIHICGGAHRAGYPEASTMFADVSTLDFRCSLRFNGCQVA